MKVLNQEIDENYSLYHGDSCEVLKGLPDNSIGFTIFSPPFSNLFSYSASFRDVGNCLDDDEFFNHFKFMIDELYRITKPGRNLAFHIMNPSYTIEHNGYIGERDLRGDLIWLFQQFGWINYGKVAGMPDKPLGEILIWKNPAVEAIRTKALRLAHKQILKDSARCGIGGCDYIVIMQKPGENLEPIENPQGLTNYAGELENEPEEWRKDLPYNDSNNYSVNVWRKYASPVWMDIRQTRTLSTVEAKDEKDEKHICPLQLDSIERCLTLWSNPGDIVLDPFGGIGSSPYVARLMGRKAVAIELKESYYKQMVKNVRKADKIFEANKNGNKGKRGFKI